MFRFLLFFAFFCAVAVTVTLNGQASVPVIDESLEDRIAIEGTASCILLLRDRLVFAAPLPITTKEQRAAFVYERLIQHAATSQTSLQELLRQEGVPFRSFYITNAIRADINGRMLAMLSKRQDIERIIDDAPVKMVNYTNDRESNALRGGTPEWGLTMMKADSVWEMGIRGQGVIVAGQDTGYDWKVAPLYKKYRGYKDDTTRVEHTFNWHDAIHKNNPRFPESNLNPCGYSVKEPCDDDNHGTHTMGTMVGEDDNNSIGVAPAARWIACRNMDRGWGQPSTYMECFEWFLAPFDEKGENADPSKSPHVINNSWYCSEEEGCNPSNFGLMDDMVKNLKASGVMVVVSAGNSGGQGCGSVTGPPAFFEPSFSVGATTRDDIIAGFSSRGPVVIDSSFRLKPNVSAPGAGVRSVIKGGGFAAFSGTSMAGPHVAGLVALIISANPSLAGRPEIIESIIESTAVPKTAGQDCPPFSGALVPNATYGYGRVDALAAVKKAITYTSGTESVPSTGSWSVWPNPTRDALFLSTSDPTQGFLELQLVSASGTVVQRHTFSRPETACFLSLEGLPAGLYLYRGQTAGGQVQGTCIKVL